MRLLTFSSILLLASAAHAVPCPPDKPVLFVVQDKSGSMNQPPDPTACSTCPTKWTSAKSAVATLTNQFQGAFRFGLMLYPYDTTTFNCTTGTVMSSVPSTPAQVAATLNAATPGGGTPTAASLQAARTYLQSQALNTPAYVLLITDGLPNCNLALDANTCTASTPGCSNNSCGLGSKDCLDDQGTIQAATDLKNAGFKVYVVGFGTSVTSGNNKTVLDNIASAGGTTSAFSANNQAALNSALSAIGYNAATCCNDLCTQGAAVCNANGELESCVMDPMLGCTVWQTQACPSQSYCSGGACVSCTNACTAGATQCVGSSAQQCVVGTYGCTEWQEQDDCTFGEQCQAGQCQSCQSCTEGASRCNGQNSEVCVKDAATGCTSWKLTACTSGSTCSMGACTVCNTTCTEGAQRCDGKTAEACVVDAAGCTSWQAQMTCSDFCSGGACGSCGTTCAIGDTRCNGASIETCTTDAHGCNTWVAQSTCAATEYCADGRCEGCRTQCPPSSRRCSAEGIEECQVEATGCTEWVEVQACAVDEGCVSGVCVAQCKDVCTAGQRKCGPSGDPLVCEKGPAGCTVWVSDPRCSAGAVCVDGLCAAECEPSDAFSCHPDEACEDRGGHLVCVPHDGDQPRIKSGCGCNAADPSALGVLLLVLGGLTVRRRR